MSIKDKTDNELRYPIGVVARRTGIHPETIRIWERRYAVVSPDTSASGRRLYSEDDVRRLELVKKLVDAGNPIGRVARLPTATLLSQLGKRPAAQDASPIGRLCRVIAIGETLPARLEYDRPQMPGIELVASWRQPDHARRDERAGAPDVVVVESAGVQADSLTEIEILRARLGARAAVLVYGFGARRLLDELEREGVQCLQAPVSAAQLRRACLSACSAGAIAAVPPAPAEGERRFDPDQLARIASLAPTLACECPRHLADLIASLAAFEAYSSECQVNKPADAKIHALLKNRAGAARALLETALAEVLQLEGIAV